MFPQDGIQGTGDGSSKLFVVPLSPESDTKIQNQSMSALSANDFPDLPSPNWDQSGISYPELPSRSQLPGVYGEKTETGAHDSANDIYSRPKRKTLGGDEGVGDE